MPEVKTETKDEADDDRPDMDADMADFADADLAAEIHESTAPETDREAWPDEGQEPELEIDGAEVTIGDIYCNLLTVLANESVKRQGSGEPLFEKADGDIDTTLARQLQLDEYVNQIAAKRGTSNMSPEQALVVSTLIFVGAVLVSDTQLLNNLMNRDADGGEEP